MIRAFLRIAVPLSAVAAVGAVFVGPNLVLGTRGEALVMTTPDAPSPFAQANLDAAECTSVELLALKAPPEETDRMLALRLPADGELAIARLEDGAGSLLVIVLDGHGTFVPLSGAEALGELAAAISRDCGEADAASAEAGAI